MLCWRGLVLSCALYAVHVTAANEVRVWQGDPAGYQISLDHRVTIVRPGTFKIEAVDGAGLGYIRSINVAFLSAPGPVTVYVVRNPAEVGGAEHEPGVVEVWSIDLTSATVGTVAELRTSGNYGHSTEGATLKGHSVGAIDIGGDVIMPSGTTAGVDITGTITQPLNITGQLLADFVCDGAEDITIGYAGPVMLQFSHSCTGQTYAGTLYLAQAVGTSIQMCGLAEGARIETPGDLWSVNTGCMPAGTSLSAGSIAYLLAGDVAGSITTNGEGLGNATIQVLSAGGSLSVVDAIPASVSIGADCRGTVQLPQGVNNFTIGGELGGTVAGAGNWPSVSIGSIDAAGVFDVAGPVGDFDVPGNLVGTVNMQSCTGYFTVGTRLYGDVNVSGDMYWLDAGYDLYGNVNVGGNLEYIFGHLGGALYNPSVVVSGSLTSMYCDMSGGGSLYVAGDMGGYLGRFNGGLFEVAGAIGSFSAEYFMDGHLHIGTLPAGKVMQLGALNSSSVVGGRIEIVDWSGDVFVYSPYADPLFYPESMTGTLTVDTNYSDTCAFAGLVHVEGGPLNGSIDINGDLQGGISADGDLAATIELDTFNGGAIGTGANLSGRITCHQAFAGSVFVDEDLTGVIEGQDGCAGTVEVAGNLNDQTSDLTTGHIRFFGKFYSTGAISIAGQMLGDTSYVSFDYDCLPTYPDVMEPWESGATVSLAGVTYTKNTADKRIWKPGCLKSDLDNDGCLTNFDIDPFVIILTGDCAAYQTRYPGLSCETGLYHADANCDGVVNTFDIDPFVKRLMHPETPDCAGCLPDCGGLRGGSALSAAGADDSGLDSVDELAADPGEDPAAIAALLASSVAPERLPVMVAAAWSLAGELDDPARAELWAEVAENLAAE